MTDSFKNVVVIFELICNFDVLQDLKFLETYMPTLIFEKKKKTLTIWSYHKDIALFRYLVGLTLVQNNQLYLTNTVVF